MRFYCSLSSHTSREITCVSAVFASSRCSRLAVPAHFGIPAALPNVPRTGGFASPLRNGFAFIVCDNMHNVGIHYKVMTRMGDMRHPTQEKSANCVTILCPQTSSKTC